MITTLLETVGEERKADLRDKIASALMYLKIKKKGGAPILQKLL